jgi:hypothetical protein
MFEPFVGETFLVEAEGETYELDLIEAKAMPVANGAPRQDPFSLLFRGSADCVLVQGMVRSTHARTGGHHLFLVPVGMDGHGKLYEAIFN